MIPCWSCVQNRRSVLSLDWYKWFSRKRKRMKDLVQRACVVKRTSGMKISRRHLADYVKKLHQRACRTCSTILFPHSTNQIIYLLCHRRCCHRRFVNSQITRFHASRIHEFKAKNLAVYTGIRSLFHTKFCAHTAN